MLLLLFASRARAGCGCSQCSREWRCKLHAKHRPSLRCILLGGEKPINRRPEKPLCSSSGWITFKALDAGPMLFTQEREGRHWWTAPRLFSDAILPCKAIHVQGSSIFIRLFCASPPLLHLSFCAQPQKPVMDSPDMRQWCDAGSLWVLETWDIRIAIPPG